MLPFYIAGTLPRTDTHRLEQHLVTCADCRRSLDEWRTIAAVVRSEAAGQMRALPPLSGRVLNAVRQRASGRPSATEFAPFTARPSASFRATSITLIAAVFTVILFGGLLAFMLRGSPNRQGGVVLVPTSTTTITLTLEITQGKRSPSPEPPESTPLAPTDAPQIIVIEPSITPSPPLVFNTPVGSLVFNTPILPTRSIPTAQAPNVIVPTLTLTLPNTFEPLIFATDGPQTFAQSMLLGTGGGASCTIRAAIPNSVVNLYAGPDLSYAIVKTFSGDDTLIALGKSDNGWYQAQYTPDTNPSVGWVRQEQVYVSGDCDFLPLIASGDFLNGVVPTASAIPLIVDAPAVTITTDGINLRGGPGTNYAVIGAGRLGETYHVEAQYSNGSQVWYLVTVPGARSAWLLSTLAQLAPANAIIPPALTIPPSPMPTASAPPPPTATVGVNISAGRWSQTITVLGTTCVGGTTGMSTTTPVTLSVSGDTITLVYAEAGTPFMLIHSGDRQYMGGYLTTNNSVSVTLTFTSSTSYSGTAITTQNDGCTVQSAWNGLFQGS